MKLFSIEPEKNAWTTPLAFAANSADPSANAPLFQKRVSSDAMAKMSSKAWTCGDVLKRVEDVLRGTDT